MADILHIFKCTFSEENFGILIEISLHFFPTKAPYP